MLAIRVVSLAMFLTFVMLPAWAQGPCVPSAPDGYSSAAGCVVVVDRDNPSSPPTLVVHGGTTVTIHVINARGNETVTFTPTTTQVSPVDVAGTFVRSAISPLTSLIAAQQTHIGAAIFSGAQLDTIQLELNGIFTSISGVLTQMADANVTLSCLEAYKTTVALPPPPPPPGAAPAASPGLTCGGLLTAATFAAQKTATIQAMVAASRAALPSVALQSAETDISNAARATPDQKTQYQAADTLIKNVVSDTQKAQATMFENASQLATYANALPDALYTVTQSKLHNSSIVVAAQEVVSKTNTTLATVVINWQSNPWEVSTGILFSALKDQSYTNAPLIINGQPVLDSSGKNTTVVQDSYSRPAIVTPLVMANYRLGPISHWGWENACPGHCAILLSGGVGLNVTASTKTAEFAVGPSFQIGEVLITAGAHIGRDTELSQGIYVGDKLGSSPPSPLPTMSRWTVKWGFAVSYVLPFQ